MSFVKLLVRLYRPPYFMETTLSRQPGPDTNIGQPVKSLSGAVLAILRRTSTSTWPIRLLVVLLFCQLWIELAGFTVRIENLLSIALLGALLFPWLFTARIRYYRSLLNVPLLLWSLVLLMGVGVTLVSPLDGVTKKDALVNGTRLIVALGLFFAIYNHPARATEKLRAVTSTIVIFSLVTTLVALMQLGYWDGWLSIPLPTVLTTFKEGANTDKGRELFALFIGNTGAHTWSGALAMQALLVWLIARHSRHLAYKVSAWMYFAVLAFLLVRISVRNSILGLFVAIVGLELLRRRRARQLVLRMLRPILISIVMALALYALFYLAPNWYFIERVRQVVPAFNQGELVISRASNIYGRLDYWVTALEIFNASPFVGGGFYSYQELSGRYGHPIVHAHNSYLQALAELGILGIVTLGLLLASIGYYLYRTRHLFVPQTPGALWWEYVTGSFVFLTFSMTFSNTFWIANYVAFRMILLGVLASLVRERAR